MFKWIALAGPATLIFAFAGPAQADLSAMQVWEKWRAQYEGMGMALAADTDVQGDTLRVTGLMATSEMPDAGGQVVIAVDEMTFQERSDGTVAISLSPTMTIDVAVTPPDASEEAVMAMTVSQTGYSIIASGDLDEIVYDFLAAEMAISLDSLMVDDEEQEFEMQVALADIDGSYTVSGEDLVTAGGTFNAATLDVAFSAVDPGDADGDAGDEGKSDMAGEASGGTVDMQIALTDVESAFDGAFAMIASDNMAEMLAAGFEITSELTHGPGSYAIEVTEDGTPTTIQIDLASGGTSTQLGADGMGYTVTANGVEAGVSSPDIPFPQLSLAAETMEFGFDMPVTATETPEDFAGALILAGLTVDEIIWGMFDPQNMLPRDPATLSVALSGQAKWFYDIMDPEAAEEMADEIPGELNALSLDTLRVSLAGAELTGDGAFTFDNTDLETFDGMPKPTGSLDLQLQGGMALLDTLVAMGFVPEDQAMGARMMLGAFARPGEGEDSLVSKIELTEDGGILANGQRIR